jgi:hypothetical protein
MNKFDAKLQRAGHANALIQIISDHGRRFFFCRSTGRVAYLILKGGRVYLVDDYTGATIYTHKTSFGNGWRGFSHGGTLRNLIEMLRDYIVHGTLLHPSYIAQDCWAYDASAVLAVRRHAYLLPMFESQDGITPEGEA